MHVSQTGKSNPFSMFALISMLAGNADRRSTAILVKQLQKGHKPEVNGEGTLPVEVFACVDVNQRRRPCHQARL